MNKLNILMTAHEEVQAAGDRYGWLSPEVDRAIARKDVLFRLIHDEATLIACGITPVFPRVPRIGQDYNAFGYERGRQQGMGDLQEDHVITDEDRLYDEAREQAQAEEVDDLDDRSAFAAGFIQAYREVTD